MAGHAAREQFDQAAAAAGFTPKVQFQTASYDVAQALVGTGIGVALVSRPALTGVPGTTYRERHEPGLARHIHAVSLTDSSLTPLVRTFLGLLLDVARETAVAWAQSACDGAPPPG